MDLIFYGDGIGNNVIPLRIDTTGITSLDIRLTNPCKVFTKDGTVSATECTDYYTADLQGVDSIYEDLSAGLIFFGELGTWRVDFYAAGLPKVPANLLQSIELQITELS